MSWVLATPIIIPFATAVLAFLISHAIGFAGEGVRA